MQDAEHESLAKRLDVIIQLLLESGSSPATTTSAKIARLLGYGLTPSEVAKIMNKKTNYISAVTAGKKQKSPNS